MIEALDGSSALACRKSLWIGTYAVSAADHSEELDLRLFDPDLLLVQIQALRYASFHESVKIHVMLFFGAAKYDSIVYRISYIPIYRLYWYSVPTTTSPNLCPVDGVVHRNIGSDSLYIFFVSLLVNKILQIRQYRQQFLLLLGNLQSAGRSGAGTHLVPF